MPRRILRQLQGTTLRGKSSVVATKGNALYKAVLPVKPDVFAAKAYSQATATASLPSTFSGAAVCSSSASAVGFDYTFKTVTVNAGVKYFNDAGSGSSSYNGTIVGSGNNVVAFSALGNSTGYFQSSDGGFSWTRRTPPSTSLQLYPVVGAGGIFVLGSNSTAIWTSSDGINWTSGAAASNNTNIFYENGLYFSVGTGTNTTIYTSTDLVTWTPRTMPVARTWTQIIWFPAAAKYVALAQGQTAIASSTDGFTWTDLAAGNLSSAQYARAVLFKGELYTFNQNAPNNYSKTSDLVNWTHLKFPINVNNSGFAKTYSANQDFILTGFSAATYFGVSYGGAVTYNGVDWQLIKDSDFVGSTALYAGGYAVPGEGRILAAIATGSTGGVYNIGVGTGAKAVATLTDLAASVSVVSTASATKFDDRLLASVSTADINTSGSATQGGWGITYGNGVWVTANGGVNSASYSTDGVTWNVATGVISVGTPTVVRFAGGKFFQTDGMGTGTNLNYSTNGSSFSQATITADNWGPPAFDGTTYVVLPGASSNVFGKAAVSTDGITWTVGGSVAGTYKDLAYGGGKFVALNAGFNDTDGDGSVIYSTDAGTTWTTVPNAVPKGNWKFVTYCGGIFVAINYKRNGGYATSTDGITWTLGYFGKANAQPGPASFVDGEIFVSLNIFAGSQSWWARSKDSVNWTINRNFQSVNYNHTWVAGPAGGPYYTSGYNANSISKVTPFSMTARGGLTVEAGTATAVSTASLFVPAVAAAFEASVAAVSTVTADLSVPKPLAASIASVASTVAGLTTQITLASSATAQTNNVLASLTTGIPLGSAIASVSSVTSAALTTQISLAASVAATASQTSALTTQIKLAASVQALSTPTGALTTGIPLAASVAAVSTTTSGLTTAIQLAASVQSLVTATSDLTSVGGGSAALASSVQCVSSVVSAALTTGIPLNGIALAGNRQNLVTNSALTGGAGTINPPGWAGFGTTNGISGTILGYVDDGGPAFDIRVFGTASAQAYYNLDPTSATIPALPGDIFVGGVDLKLIAGSMTGTFVAVSTRDNDALNGYLFESTLNATPTSSWQRFTTPINPLIANTAFTGFFLYVPVATGISIDFTVRVRAPQFEKASVPTGYSPTFGTALNDPVIKAPLTTAIQLAANAQDTSNVVLASLTTGIPLGAAAAVVSSVASANLSTGIQLAASVASISSTVTATLTGVAAQLGASVQAQSAASAAVTTSIVLAAAAASSATAVATQMISAAAQLAASVASQSLVSAYLRTYSPTATYNVSQARADLLYQLALLHGLVIGSPLKVSATSRLAGEVSQTLTAAGTVTVHTNTGALQDGDLNQWIDALAAIYGLTTDLTVTSATRNAGSIMQTISTDGVTTTVTRL